VTKREIRGIEREALTNKAIVAHCSVATKSTNNKRKERRVMTGGDHRTEFLGRSSHAIGRGKGDGWMPSKRKDGTDGRTNTNKHEDSSQSCGVMYAGHWVIGVDDV